MVSFAATNQQSELAFQEFKKSKMKAEKEKTATERHHYLMFLIKKTIVVKLVVKILNSSKTCEEVSSSFIS